MSTVSINKIELINMYCKDKFPMEEKAPNLIALTSFEV